MSKTSFTVEVKEAMLDLCGGYCECGNKDCEERATEFHHLLSNTKVNQKKFPHFLQSPFNCCPINHKCHMCKPLPRIRERHAIVYEKWLEKLCQKQLDTLK